MPLFVHPTEILCVDDDALFLEIISEELNNKYRIQKFNSPEECLGFFKKYQSASTSLSLLKGCKDHDDYDLAGHLPVDVNINSIINLQNNQARFSDIAVMVIDYNMPKKTGIELCAELRGLPVKKILLTGEASHQKAVEAFNSKIIDCFIRKDEVELQKKLVYHIEELQKQYFKTITGYLLFHLEADYYIPQSDPIFIEFFYEWCKKNNITEYYLIDKYGTLLTITENGRISFFIIHTDRSLEAFIELYSHDDTHEINFLIQSVKQRARIPFFGLKKESWNFEFEHWINYFYTPSILKGRENYYWAVVES